MCRKAHNLTTTTHALQIITQIFNPIRYVRQYFLRGFFPSRSATTADQLTLVPEALVRATIIAGARQMTGTVTDSHGAHEPLPAWYPNYAAGFGRPMLDRSLYEHARACECAGVCLTHVVGL